MKGHENFNTSKIAGAFAHGTYLVEPMFVQYHWAKEALREGFPHGERVRYSCWISLYKKTIGPPLVVF